MDTSKQATESQTKALIACLRDYIALMESQWPNQVDVVKSKAKALLNELTGGKQ